MDVDQAETQVSRCEIRSPFRAAVIQRHVGLGEFARTGTVLLDIEDLDRVEVSAQVVPSDVPSLADTPDIFLDYSGQRFGLSLGRISPVIDRTTRTQEVRLTFSSHSAPVGASGRLVWTEVHPGIPGHLLVERNGRLGVFLVEKLSLIHI